MSIARKEWLCGMMGALACHGVWAAFFLWEEAPRARPSKVPSTISIVLENDILASSGASPFTSRSAARQNHQTKDGAPMTVAARPTKLLTPSKGRSEIKQPRKKAPSQSLPPSLAMASHSASTSAICPPRQEEAVLPQDRDVQPLVAPPPHYPEEARRLGEQETVLVRVRVSETGQVSRVDLVKGTHRSLIQAALRVVRTWLFPVQRKGKYSVLVPISFSLNREEESL
ncbi:MAG: energy transducer TonB [Alphaproteobacteria bacterium]|nr:energy transducer TonB [Alphaproteobacteria bacterium]